MQNIKNILIKASVALSAAILAIGCINEKESVREGLQNVTVQMNIAQESLTKAAPVTSMGALEIFAYTGTDRRLAGHYYNASYSQGAVYIHLRLPQTGTHDVTFHVVALDAAAVNAGKTIDIDDNISERDLLVSVSADVSAIYMTGSIDASLNVETVLPAPGAAAGEHSDHNLIGNIDVDLKRMVSSVSIHAAKAEGYTGNLSIERIEWTNLKSLGYLFAKEDDVLASVQNVSSATPYWTIGKEVTKTRTGAVDVHADYDEMLSFLAFENPYGSADWSAANTGGLKLRILYTGGEGVVYMPPMVRNTHYDVYCTIEADGVISVEFTVADWEDADMWDGGLTFDYPTHTFLVPEPDANSVSSAPAVMTYGQGSDLEPFECYFQMSAPANQAWTPTVFNGIAADCKVEVWNAAGTAELSAPYLSGSDWYRIRVIPQNQSNYGKEVMLAITYKPIWTDHAEYLVINGNSSHPVWPYAGTAFENDSDYIIITQQ